MARPGDSTRIVQIRDIIEPKVKVSGPGVTYPGISGRDVSTVGQGRTHRLGGMTLIACSEMPGFNPDGAHWWGTTSVEGRSDITFVDMSGPGAVLPFASTLNLCLQTAPHHEAYADDWNRASNAALLRVNDRLGETTRNLEPKEVMTYDLDERDEALPNIVFVPAFASAEYRFGPRTSLGTNVYGIGRLTEPWLLQPTEMIDGAVFGTYMEHFTWPIVETIVPHLCSRHGVDFNFVGCASSCAAIGRRRPKNSSWPTVRRRWPLPLGAKRSYRHHQSARPALCGNRCSQCRRSNARGWKLFS